MKRFNFLYSQRHSLKLILQVIKLLLNFISFPIERKHIIPSSFGGRKENCLAKSVCSLRYGIDSSAKVDRFPLHNALQVSFKVSCCLFEFTDRVFELLSIECGFDIDQSVVERICLYAFPLFIEQDISISFDFTNLDLAFQDVEYISAEPLCIGRIFDIRVRLADKTLADIDAKRKRKNEINILSSHFFNIALAVESSIQNEETLCNAECFYFSYKILQSHNIADASRKQLEVKR